MGKFRQYFTVAFRFLIKHWFTSCLSLLGLAAAFSLCILSGIILWQAYSSDGQWKNASQIYILDRKLGFSYYDLPEGFIEDVRTMSPEIMAMSGISLLSISFKRGDKIDSHWPQTVDAGFSDMFLLDSHSGDFKTAVQTRGMVALSEQLAFELYGDEPAIGQIFETSKGEILRNYIVGAVYKAPKNTAIIRSKIMFLYDPVYEKPFHQFFLVLKKRTDVEELAARLTNLLVDKYPDREAVGRAPLRLIPLKGTKLESLNRPDMKMRYLGLFYASLLMLLVALMNYISLTTATAITRAKDIALRKILGAGKAELSGLFILESIMLISFAYLASIGLAALLAPQLANLTGEDFDLDLADNSALLIAGYGIAVFIGLVAAAYPVWVMVHGKIASALRSFQRNVAGGGTRLRFILLVLQAMFGIGLTFGAGVIYFQISNMEHSDKGFDTRGLLYLRFWGEGTMMRDASVAMVPAIRRIEGVENAGMVYSSNPLEFRVREYSMEHPATRLKTPVATMRVGDQFIETLGLPVLAGRMPLAPPVRAKDSPEPDVVAVVVNQRFIRDYELGSWDAALGRCLYYYQRDERSDICYRISAVVGNHYQKFDENPITPIVFILESGNIFYNVMVRYDPEREKEVFDLLETVWDEHIPLKSIYYRYLSDIIDADLGTQKAIAILLLFTAIGSLFLTIAGLYAMAKFIVGRRGREIAIRRVLGASTYDIVKLVAIQLAKPIILGAVIGLPLGWYYAMDWLSAYTIRIEPEPWHAVLLGIVGIVFFLLSATGEILRAVRIRPAEALHYE